MPYNTASALTALTASFLNTNYRDQVISIVTSATRPSGIKGQVIFETDTNKFFAYSGAAWEEIARVGAWTPWTPTWVNITVGNGATAGSYIRYGRFIAFSAKMVFGTTSSVGGNIAFTLPFTATSNLQRGQLNCSALDGGTANYPGWCDLGTTTITLSAIATGGAYALPATMNATVPFTFGNGDEISVSGFYESVT